MSALSELLKRLEDNGIDAFGIGFHPRVGLREILLATLMLLILIVRPQGITAGRELSWPGLRSRMPRSVAEQPVPMEPRSGAS